jgi:hypothetical protein
LCASYLGYQASRAACCGAFDEPICRSCCLEFLLLGQQNQNRLGAGNILNEATLSNYNQREPHSRHCSGRGIEDFNFRTGRWSNGSRSSQIAQGEVRLGHASLMQPIDRSRNDVRVEAATLQPERLRQRSLRQPLQVESLCLLFSASVVSWPSERCVARLALSSGCLHRLERW